MLLDQAGRIKPCGGAVPPRLLSEFAIPEAILVARATSARMISPASNRVDMPVGKGFVGMVDRGSFDEWLRVRAAEAGAERRTGRFERIEQGADGVAVIVYAEGRDGPRTRVRARMIIGADGARSAVARSAFPASETPPFVYAYHEIIESPLDQRFDFDGSRCDVYYQGRVSPDFYGWIFPHGAQTSVGVGSANKGFALRDAVGGLRRDTGLDSCVTVRGEGAPIPLKPRKRWDNGHNLILAGDAAGVVAPASGEGIYYAMASGRMVAQAVDHSLATGNPKALRGARKQFMKAHGRVFAILGMMQYFWYDSDKRRERFVKICEDPDVQQLTWLSYMNKELQFVRPAAHARIFFKDLGHLLGLVA
jgi:geranylgeranyl diphosphate/geranylgeranyl-bacteriochlorophyllide a reductase